MIRRARKRDARCMQTDRNRSMVELDEDEGRTGEKYEKRK